MSADTRNLFLIILFFLVMFKGAYLFKKERCLQRAESFEDSKFGLFSGCMVKHNNRWLPLENIRGFDND